MGIKQPEQRSPEWFELRKGKITASEYSACIKYDEYLKELTDNHIMKVQKSIKVGSTSCSSYSSRHKYIGVKSGIIARDFCQNEFTQWGVKYEPIATSIYEYDVGTEVVEFGLLPHSTIPFLGASPDGITKNGIMLEIKCPFSDRQIGVPNIGYWMQMQLQLEVADMNYCDFQDCRIREYRNFEEYEKDDVSKYKGMILTLRYGNTPGNSKE